MKHLLLIASLISLDPNVIFADSKTVEGAKEDLHSFKKDVKNSLSKIDKDLSALSSKAKDKGGEMKAKTVEEAKLARARIDAQLEELKDKSNESWLKAKKEISASVDSLSNKIQAALK